MEERIRFYKKIAELQMLMQQYKMKKHGKRGPMADTTRGQGRILALLKMQDEISTKELSYLLGIRVSSLNELLAKMEKNEYIVREPSSEDKRVLLVKLTEKGKNEEQQELNQGDLFDCLNGEEKEKFAEYIDRVTAAFAAEIGEDMDEVEKNWWMHDARKRMGNEKFEKFMFMHDGGSAFRGGHHGRGGDPRMQQFDGQCEHNHGNRKFRHRAHDFESNQRHCFDDAESNNATGDTAEANESN